MGIIPSSIVRPEYPTETGVMQTNKNKPTPNVANTQRNKQQTETTTDVMNRQGQITEKQKMEERITHYLQKKHYGHHT